MVEKKEIKEPKVKKLFTIKLTVWEDGECEAEMKEFIDSPTGRGRPGEWRRTPVEFVQKVEERLGDFNKCLADWSKAIGKDAKDCLGLSLSMQASAQAQSSISVTPVSPVVKVEEKKQDKPKKPNKKDKDEEKSEEDQVKDDFDNMDFGKLDEDKDK